VKYDYKQLLIESSLTRKTFFRRNKTMNKKFKNYIQEVMLNLDNAREFLR